MPALRGWLARRMAPLRCVHAKMVGVPEPGVTIPRAASDLVGVPAPGPHGGDGARVAAALGLAPDAVLDLSLSLNPFAPDVAALATRHLGALRRYPDIDTAEALIAEMIGVPSERLVLTAGGSQAIALVAEHLGAGWVDEPDFSLYARHLPRLDPGAPRWRSDPHNPTGLLADQPNAGTAPDDNPTGLLADQPDAGTALAHPERAVVAAGMTVPHAGPKAPDAVWDEAFLPLSAGRWTRRRPGWALGSLTKAFACPGLRLGYAIAPTDAEAAALRERRPAWAVGGLACAVVPDLVAAADPPGWTRRIATARAATGELLRRHGLEPLPSDAPWLLVPHAAGLRQALALHGVVVRDCSSFGLPGHVRIAVPDAAGLDRLDLALRSATANASDSIDPLPPPREPAPGARLPSEILAELRRDER